MYMIIMLNYYHLLLVMHRIVTFLVYYAHVYDLYVK